MALKAKSKIGEFLAERNFITSEQVEQVLELQKHHSDKKFGEIALEIGHINFKAINQYLVYKHTGV